jgi:phosphoglycerate dehydrogenase-like enzyme
LHKERLRRLPKHAVVINVGRGSLIPEQDLVEVLKAGELAGAGLDVLPQEPLPAESELWSLPNVIITPHNSGLTPFFKARALEIFLENWASFVETGRPVRNVVEREKGY